MTMEFDACQALFFIAGGQAESRVAAATATHGFRDGSHHHLPLLRRMLEQPLIAIGVKVLMAWLLEPTDVGRVRE